MIAALEVLAMRVPPGLKHRIGEIEDEALHLWRSDHGCRHPNMVFVAGSPSSLETLRRVAKQHTIALVGSGHATIVWDFENRGDADHFVRLVSNNDNLHFWQVGRSDAYASALRVPLLRYFMCYDKEGGSHPSITRLTHALRKKTVEVTEEYRYKDNGQVRRIMTVWLAHEIVQSKRLPLRPWYKPVRLLKNKLAEGEELFAHTESFLSGKATVHGMDCIYRILHEDEAYDYFRRASLRNIGFGFMFRDHR